MLRKNTLTTIKKTIAGAMAVTFAYTTISAPLAEANFWNERRKAVEKNGYAQNGNGSHAQNQYAQLPNGLSHLNNALPSITSGSMLEQVGQIPQEIPGIKDLTPQQKQLKKLPSWLTSLPTIYGDIREVHIAKGKEQSLPTNRDHGLAARRAKGEQPLVIHIQDVHGYYDSQKNIASMIEHMAGSKGQRAIPSDKQGPWLSSKEGKENKHQPLLVALEGAAGAFDLAPFREFPDKKLLSDVSDFLLKENMIAGPELAAWNGKAETELWGVEDRDLYLANGQAYKDFLPYEKQLNAEIDKLTLSLNQIKSKVYTPALTALDQKQTAYHEDKIGLGQYVRFLSKSKGKQLAHHKNLSLFLETLKTEESLNFKNVENERAQLIHRLASALSKKQMEALVQKSMHYRMGHISYAGYYAYLKAVCRKNGVDLRKYPQMDKYIQYVLNAERIEKEQIFVELKTLETKVQNSLIKTDKQKAVHDMSCDLTLVKKLTSFTMSPDDWTGCEKNKERILSLPARIREIGNSKLEMGKGQPVFASMIEPGMRFCETAIKRNEALINNLMSKLNNVSNQKSKIKNQKLQEPHAAVLVAGGFHTPGMTALLKKSNISYVVITPQIKEIKKDHDYLDFLRHKTPLEKIFTTEKITYAPPKQIGVLDPVADDVSGAQNSMASILAVVANVRGIWMPQMQLAVERMTGFFVHVAESVKKAGVAFVTVVSEKGGQAVSRVKFVLSPNDKAVAAALQAMEAADSMSGQVGDTHVAAVKQDVYEGLFTKIISALSSVQTQIDAGFQKISWFAAAPLLAFLPEALQDDGISVMDWIGIISFSTIMVTLFFVLLVALYMLGVLTVERIKSKNMTAVASKPGSLTRLKKWVKKIAPRNFFIQLLLLPVFGLFSTPGAGISGKSPDNKNVEDRVSLEKAVNQVYGIYGLTEDGFKRTVRRARYYARRIQELGIHEDKNDEQLQAEVEKWLEDEIRVRDVFEQPIGSKANYLIVMDLTQGTNLRNILAYEESNKSLSRKDFIQEMGGQLSNEIELMLIRMAQMGNKKIKKIGRSLQNKALMASIVDYYSRPYVLTTDDPNRVWTRGSKLWGGLKGNQGIGVYCDLPQEAKLLSAQFIKEKEAMSGSDEKFVGEGLLDFENREMSTLEPMAGVNEPVSAYQIALLFPQALGEDAYDRFDGYKPFTVKYLVPGLGISNQIHTDFGDFMKPESFVPLAVHPEHGAVAFGLKPGTTNEVVDKAFDAAEEDDFLPLLNILNVLKADDLNPGDLVNVNPYAMHTAGCLDLTLEDKVWLEKVINHGMVNILEVAYNQLSQPNEIDRATFRVSDPYVKLGQRLLGIQVSNRHIDTQLVRPFISKLKRISPEESKRKPENTEQFGNSTSQHHEISSHYHIHIIQLNDKPVVVTKNPKESMMGETVVALGKIDPNGTEEQNRANREKQKIQVTLTYTEGPLMGRLETIVLKRGEGLRIPANFKGKYSVKALGQDTWAVRVSVPQSEPSAHELFLREGIESKTHKFTSHMLIEDIVMLLNKKDEGSRAEAANRLMKLEDDELDNCLYAIYVRLMALYEQQGVDVASRFEKDEAFFRDVIHRFYIRQFNLYESTDVDGQTESRIKSLKQKAVKEFYVSRCNELIETLNTSDFKEKRFNHYLNTSFIKLIEYARELNDADSQAHAQTIITNAVQIACGIMEEKRSGAPNHFAKLRLTTDKEMLMSGTEGEPLSFLLVPKVKGLETTNKDGGPGVFWRRLENGKSKMGMDEAASMLAYTMIHDGNYKGLTPLHTTAMLPAINGHKTSNAPKGEEGHDQVNEEGKPVIDFKFLVYGRINQDGQVYNKGEYFLALPKNKDTIINENPDGVTVFHDFSVEVTEEQAKALSLKGFTEKQRMQFINQTQKIIQSNLDTHNRGMAAAYADARAARKIQDTINALVNLANKISEQDENRMTEDSKEIIALLKQNEPLEAYHALMNYEGYVGDVVLVLQKLLGLNSRKIIVDIESGEMNQRLNSYISFINFVQEWTQENRNERDKDEIEKIKTACVYTKGLIASFAFNVAQQAGAPAGIETYKALNTHLSDAEKAGIAEKVVNILLRRISSSPVDKTVVDRVDMVKKIKDKRIPQVLAFLAELNAWAKEDGFEGSETILASIAAVKQQLQPATQQVSKEKEAQEAPGIFKGKPFEKTPLHELIPGLIKAGRADEAADVMADALCERTNYDFITKDLRKRYLKDIDDTQVAALYTSAFKALSGKADKLADAILQDRTMHHYVMAVLLKDMHDWEDSNSRHLFNAYEAVYKALFQKTRSWDLEKIQQYAVKADSFVEKFSHIYLQALSHAKKRKEFPRPVSVGFANLGATINTKNPGEVIEYFEQQNSLMIKLMTARQAMPEGAVVFYPSLAQGESQTFEVEGSPQMPDHYLTVTSNKDVRIVVEAKRPGGVWWQVESVKLNANQSDTLFLTAGLLPFRKFNDELIPSLPMGSNEIRVTAVELKGKGKADIQMELSDQPGQEPDQAKLSQKVKFRDIGLTLRHKVDKDKRPTKEFTKDELFFPQAGTSGFRVDLADFTDMQIYAGLKATIEDLKEKGQIVKGEKIPLPLAGDRRPTTTRVMIALSKAITDAGYDVEYVGRLPTPALTLYGLYKEAMSVMSTVSHNPIQHNGAKANKFNGELLRADIMSIQDRSNEILRDFLNMPAKDMLFDRHGRLRKDLVEQNKAIETVKQQYETKYNFEKLKRENQIEKQKNHKDWGVRAAALLVEDIMARDGLSFSKALEEAKTFDGDYAPISRDGTSLSRDAEVQYIERYKKMFPKDSLKKADGSPTTMVLYRYMSVGFNVKLAQRILENAGARVIEVGKDEIFAPIDTEALEDQHLELFQKIAEKLAKGQLEYVENGQKKTTPIKVDVVATKDGDDDRPLVVGVKHDKDGVRTRFIPGQMVVASAAVHLKARALVLAANGGHPEMADVMNKNVKGMKVVYTRVGSPEVVEMMKQLIEEFSQEDAEKAGADWNALSESEKDSYRQQVRVVGGEANGGTMVSYVMEDGEIIAMPLLTRDANLPMLSALTLAAKNNVSVFDLQESMGFTMDAYSGLVDYEGDFKTMGAAVAALNRPKSDVTEMILNHEAKLIECQFRNGTVKSFAFDDLKQHLATMGMKNVKGDKIVFEDNGDIVLYQGSKLLRRLNPFDPNDRGWADECTKYRFFMDAVEAVYEDDGTISLRDKNDEELRQVEKNTEEYEWFVNYRNKFKAFFPDEIPKDIAKTLKDPKGFTAIKRMRWQDGVRITFSDGEVAHLRPSGNAAQMRIYASAASEDRVRSLVKFGTYKKIGPVQQFVDITNQEAAEAKEKREAATPGLKFVWVETLKKGGLIYGVYGFMAVAFIWSKMSVFLEANLWAQLIAGPVIVIVVSWELAGIVMFIIGALIGRRFARFHREDFSSMKNHLNLDEEWMEEVRNMFPGFTVEFTDLGDSTFGQTDLDKKVMYIDNRLTKKAVYNPESPGSGALFSDRFWVWRYNRRLALLRPLVLSRERERALGRSDFSIFSRPLRAAIQVFMPQSVSKDLLKQYRTTLDELPTDVRGYVYDVLSPASTDSKAKQTVAHLVREERVHGLELYALLKMDEKDISHHKGTEFRDNRTQRIYDVISAHDDVFVAFKNNSKLILVPGFREAYERLNRGYVFDNGLTSAQNEFLNNPDYYVQAEFLGLTDKLEIEEMYRVIQGLNWLAENTGSLLGIEGYISLTEAAKEAAEKEMKIINELVEMPGSKRVGTLTAQLDHMGTTSFGANPRVLETAVENGAKTGNFTRLGRELRGLIRREKEDSDAVHDTLDNLAYKYALWHNVAWVRMAIEATQPESGPDTEGDRIIELMEKLFEERHAFDKIDKNRLFWVIMAGGSGTRLAPLNTKSTPKQWTEELTGKALVHGAIERGEMLGIAKENILIVTTKEQYDTAVFEAEKAGLSADQIIADEEQGVDTFVVNAVSSLRVLKIAKDRGIKNPLIENVQADHIWEKPEMYAGMIKNALAAADSGAFSTTAIEPSFPHSGLGHAIPDVSSESLVPGSRICSFIEKPKGKDLDWAMAQEDIGWSISNFSYSAQKYRDSFMGLAPDYAIGLSEIEQALGTDTEETVVKKWMDIWAIWKSEKSTKAGDYQHTYSDRKDKISVDFVTNELFANLRGKPSNLRRLLAGLLGKAKVYVKPQKFPWGMLMVSSKVEKEAGWLDMGELYDAPREYPGNQDKFDENKNLNMSANDLAIVRNEKEHSTVKESNFIGPQDESKKVQFSVVGVEGVVCALGSDSNWLMVASGSSQKDASKRLWSELGKRDELSVYIKGGANQTGYGQDHYISEFGSQTDNKGNSYQGTGHFYNDETAQNNRAISDQGLISFAGIEGHTVIRYNNHVLVFGADYAKPAEQVGDIVKALIQKEETLPALNDDTRQFLLNMQKNGSAFAKMVLEQYAQEPTQPEKTDQVDLLSLPEGMHAVPIPGVVSAEINQAIPAIEKQTEILQKYKKPGDIINTTRKEGVSAPLAAYPQDRLEEITKGMTDEQKMSFYKEEVLRVALLHSMGRSAFDPNKEADLNRVVHETRATVVSLGHQLLNLGRGDWKLMQDYYNHARTLSETREQTYHWFHFPTMDSEDEQYRSVLQQILKLLDSVPQDKRQEIADSLVITTNNDPKLTDNNIKTWMRFALNINPSHIKVLNDDKYRTSGKIDGLKIAEKLAEEHKTGQKASLEWHKLIALRAYMPEGHETQVDLSGIAKHIIKVILNALGAIKKIDLPNSDEIDLIQYISIQA